MNVTKQRHGTDFMGRQQFGNIHGACFLFSFCLLQEDYVRMCKNQNISPETHATYLRFHILQRDLSSTCAQRLAFAQNSAECNPESLQRWIKQHLIVEVEDDPPLPTDAAAAGAAAAAAAGGGGGGGGGGEGGGGGGAGGREALATVFIMGNISAEETAAFGASAAESFGVQPQPHAAATAATAGGGDGWGGPESRIVKLKRLTLIQVAAQNKEEESSAIEYYFQLGQDTLPGPEGSGKSGKSARKRRKQADEKDTFLGGAIFLSACFETQSFQLPWQAPDKRKEEA